MLEQEPEIIARDLYRWQDSLDFEGVREPEALAHLPETERQAWQSFWADVADTLARAMSRIPPK